jgi:Fe-S cluster biogenesis protein NfuA
MQTTNFQQELRKIEGLVRTIESAADPHVRASTVELLETVMSLHREGIERMMEIVFRAGKAGEAMIDDFARDDVIANLLLLYGLHPLDLEMRVRQALDQVRPFLRSHGGDVELLGIADGAVRLRLQGSCHGCGSSALTLKQTIEEAIYNAAPDLTTLEVEGVAEPLPPSGLVQLQKSPKSVSVL